MSKRFTISTNKRSMTLGPDAASSTTHAHPLQQDSTLLFGPPIIGDARQASQDSRVVGLIEFYLHGDPVAPKEKGLDLFCPRVLRTPWVDDNHTILFPKRRYIRNVVTHLDIVSCWKGISHDQAIELTVWETIFQTCLEEAAEQCVVGHMLTYLKNYHKPVDNESILRILSEYLTDQGPEIRMFINIPELVVDMAEIMRYSDEYPVPGRFSSSHKLRTLVCAFLETRNCFYNTPEGPALSAHVDCRQQDNKLHVFAEVLWRRPKIYFPNLETMLRPGDEYCVTPQYLYLDLYRHCLDVAHPPDRPTTVTFDLDPEETSVHRKWDEDNRCFRVKVPENYGFLWTYLSATIIHPFTDNVYYRQISRYVIYAAVPTFLPGHPMHRGGGSTSILHRPENYKPSTRGHSLDSSRACAVRVEEEMHKEPQKCRDAQPSLNDVTFQSPLAFQRTRLALDKFEHLDLESTTPRQKTIKRLDSGVQLLPHDPVDEGGTDNDDLPPRLGAVSTGPLGDAIKSPKSKSPMWSKRLENDSNHDGSHVSRSRAYEARASKVMPALKKKGSVKRMLFRWPKSPTNNDSLPNSRSSDEPSDESSDESNDNCLSYNNTSDPRKYPIEPVEQQHHDTDTLLDLRQSQIQANYKRFHMEAQAKRVKEEIENTSIQGRVVSATEYKIFESIFLGQEGLEEDWNKDSDVDGDDDDDDDGSEDGDGDGDVEGMSEALSKIALSL